MLKEARGDFTQLASRRLLADFRHFFVVSESGCRYFFGTLAELDAELLCEHREGEQRYVRNLNRLAAAEEQTLHVARRKAAKGALGAEVSSIELHGRGPLAA